MELHAVVNEGAAYSNGRFELSQLVLDSLEV